VSFLLDTDVLAELARRKPEPRVVRWFRSVPEDALHLSVLALGDLRGAIEGAKGARREKLRVWVERELPERLGDRLLAITPAVADRWGRLRAEGDRRIPAIDSLLAATALTHRLRIATRDVRAFRFPGLEVVNPWEAGG
jgi:predicted nucleic acid-binding protein